MSVEAIVTLIKNLLAVTLFLQSAELLRLRPAWSENGIWRWSVLREEFVRLPVMARSALDLMLEERGFYRLLCLRFASAIVLLFTPMSTSLAPVLIFISLVSTILISIRWRGAFNGGSDAMTVIVITGLALSFFTAPEIGLWYIAAQISLSFFFGGLVKLREPTWWSGEALAGFLTLYQFGEPPRPTALARFAPRRFIMRAASWLIIAWECLFPAALLNSNVAMIFVALALIFHLVNIYAFGLNRFLFAWGAAYPAFLYSAGAL